MRINPKFTASKIDNFDIVERVKNMSSNERRMWGAGVGAAGGALSAGFDDSDDSLGSTTKKAIIGSAVAVGADIGAGYALNTKWGKELTAAFAGKKVDTEQSKDLTKNKDVRADNHINETAEAEKLTEPETTHKVSDTTKSDVNGETKAQFDKQAKSKKMNKWLRNGRLAGMIGLGAFAVATALDTNESLAQNKRTTRMTEEQERNLTRKMKREEKEQKQYSYGYVGMGDIVHELFENRIGHHKMGNAKFQ